MKSIIILVLYFLIFIKLFSQEKPFQFPKNFSKENYLTNAILIQTHHKNFTFSERLKSILGEIYTKPVLSSDKWEKQLKNKKTERLLNIHTLFFSNSVDIEKVINETRKEKDILYAEPAYINKPFLVPNDPLAQPTPSQYYLQKISAYQAWDISTGNPNVLIGITDNGTNINHPDLNGNQFMPMGVNVDVADNDTDPTGGIHGDMVTLCASAVPNNGVGGAGTGYNCKYIPIKIAPNSNLNLTIAGYEGVLTAAQVPNCKVINMSWGRPGSPSTIEYNFLADILATYDIVLVAASGNDNTNTLYFPASYDDLVISVGATDANDIKSTFTTYNSSVDIVAPGTNIVTAVGTFSGTSFAAPLVSGAIALMRSHYPTLNREQITARLLSTVDNIDNLNPGFVGKLGKGRLNMFRALNDPLLAVGLNSYNFPGGTRNALYAGQTSNFICTFKNYLNAMNNLQVTISSNSSFLTIIDSQSNVGNVNANTTITNNNDVFILKAHNLTPNNTLANITFQYTADGGFSYSETITFILNPSLIDINQLSMTIGDKGTFSVFNGEYPYNIAGLTYKDDVMLVSSGLLLGTSIDTVSNAVRSVNAFTIENNFVTTSPTKITNFNTNYLETSTTYTDAINNVKAIGIEVTQKTYAWNFTALQKSIVFEFQLKNNSNKNIASLFTGVYADWDIGDFTKNMAAWDNDNQMGYVYDAPIPTRYGGIVVLTNRPLPSQKGTFVNYFAFNNDSTSAAGVPSLVDGFTTSDKFIAMSGQPFCTSSCASATKGYAGLLPNGANVSYLVSTKVNNLKIGETRSVAFAFVTADNLTELKQNAQNIRNKFRLERSGTKPTDQTLNACKGQTINIIPNNGNQFNFYTEIPTNPNATPIATGSILSLQNITENTTIYVTNIDGVFESDFATFTINIPTIITNFTNNNPTIVTGVPQTFNATESAGNTYHWSFRLGTNPINSPNHIVFLGGTNNTSVSPQVNFLVAGTYRVCLNITTAQGCVDSLVRNIQVFTDITTALENTFDDFQVYPNPTPYQKIFITASKLAGEQNLFLMNTLGKEISTFKVFFEVDKPTEIPLENLPKGIYYLKIPLDKNKQTIVRKVIIE
jgi:hypothetical protein